MADEASISFTVKTKAGDLFTVRGSSVAEFRANLAELIGNPQVQDYMSALFEMAQKVPAPFASGAAAAHAGLQVVGESYEPPWRDAGPQELPQSMTPACQDCGSPMRYEEWVGKQGKNAGKQFKAWKCPRDKDHRVQWAN